MTCRGITIAKANPDCRYAIRENHYQIREIFIKMGWTNGAHAVPTSYEQDHVHKISVESIKMTIQSRVPGLDLDH
jgi:hypothetical protein